MNYQVGDCIGISVQALYNQFGEKLYQGRIERNEQIGCCYYDLYNTDGTLACMDGEQVFVNSIDDGKYTLESVDGGESVKFTLTKEEMSVAVY